MRSHGNRLNRGLPALIIMGGLFICLPAQDGLAQTPPACQQSKYFLPDAIGEDLAGSDVELTQGYLFIAKNPIDPTYITPGGVHIFRPGMGPNTWVEVYSILDPLIDGRRMQFGASIGVDNDRLIVMALNDYGVSAGSGAAYIFRFDASTITWEIEDKIFADHGVTKGVVSINGDIAIIGCPSHSHDGIVFGAAHIFRFNGTSWSEEAELLAGDRDSFDRFGAAVAVVGNVAIVGAYQDDDLGTDSGSVYVFKEFGGSWIQTGKIRAPDGIAGDHFGLRLDFNGSTVAIGANLHEYGAPDRGAVYLFKENGLPGWELITMLTPPLDDDGRNDNFGRSIDLDLNSIAIGSQRSLSLNAVHIYRNTGVAWDHVLRLVAQDGPISNAFGSAVAIHNETVAIGAPWDYQIASSAGAFYTHINIFVPDCNKNCISDTLEISTGAEFDCNANGILDVCDLSDGVTLDCNNNGIPDECEDCDNNGIADECEFTGQFLIHSPELSPVGLGFPVSHTFTEPPEALDDVTLNFKAVADLGSVYLTLDVYLNNIYMGNIFRYTGSRCPTTPDEDRLVVKMDDFNTLVNGGDAVIRIETTDSVEFDTCNGTSWVSVTLSYIVPPDVQDLNANGIPDNCELSMGDNNLDGTVNVTDLIALLAAWGVCPACPEDTNLDGLVNVTDLLNLLAGWG